MARFVKGDIVVLPFPFSDFHLKPKKIDEAIEKLIRILRQ